MSIQKINIKNTIKKSRESIKNSFGKYSQASLLLDLSPWQMISVEEKTEDWFKWNMDWFESVGFTQVRKESKKIIKNRNMAVGILDLEDYGTGSEYQDLIDVIDKDKKDPLQLFYPLAPPIINVLRGEFLKRDNRIQITCVDPKSINDKIEYKQGLVEEIIIQNSLKMKEEALAKLGITKDNPQTAEKYSQELENEKKLKEADNKFKNYKHRMELWGQHIHNVDVERFNFEELELEAFTESLSNSRAFFHIDMLEDDYKPEFLDSAYCFWHKSHNIKYASDGDYFGWFQEMTPGDIVNKLGKRLKEKDYETIAKVLSLISSGQGGNAWLTNDQKAFPGAYYDTSKPFPDGRKNIPMEQSYEQKVIEEFMSNNFENYSTSQIMDVLGKSSSILGQPKLFRVMRVYWKTQRKIGWLNKIDKNGVPSEPVWVDENYKITEKPIYDHSLNKDKVKENLVYGEHIDWEWANEWRHGIKISDNRDSAHWSSYSGEFEPIYLDGEPIEFQFKGKDNPFEVYPPIEGLEFKTKGVRPVSLIDLLYPYQITANICENKATAIMVDDYGKLLYHNQATIPRSRMGVSDTQDNIANYYDEVRATRILPGHFDKEVASVLGPNASQTPQVVDMSIINDALQYKQMARMIKEDAMEVVGVTRQRLGQQKASETATGIEAGINFSESQTEIYFNQFSNELMPRVYQRMLEAAQYYHYKKGSTKISYRNDKDENVVLEVESLDDLLRDFNIKAMSKPRMKQVRKMLQHLFLSDNTLEIDAYDRAQGIYADSSVELMENLRKAKINKEKQDEIRHQREMELQKQAQDAAKEARQLEFDQESKENQLDRESDEKIAETRMMGGIQTDSNSNTVIDAQENLNYLLNKSKVENDQNYKNSQLTLLNKKHEDTMLLQQQKMMNDQIIKQKELAIALVNKNKSEDNKLSRSIAKKQGVSKK